MSLTSKRRARHSGGDSSAAPSREASISHDAGFIPAVPSAGITPRRRSNAVIQRKDATPRGRRSMHATELELAPPWWIVRHGGAMHEFMSATLFVLALYGCIAGPWQAAFGDPSRAGGYHILDEVCEAIYLIVAIPGTICTSVHVEAKGTELVSLAALFRIHVRERGFLLDISSFCWRLSALSVDRSPGTVSFTVRSCNFLRLLRLHRILAQGDSSNAVVSGFLGVGKLFFGCSPEHSLYCLSVVDGHGRIWRTSGARNSLAGVPVGRFAVPYGRAAHCIHPRWPGQPLWRK
mmetsp:Transcript_39150/g.87911  ORF Transcript_39150/g.87911 Transcript_39150/m.87911 type:complete len:292 (+) Transcript_39150:23-898(+)